MPQPKGFLPTECVDHSAVFSIACGRYLNHFEVQVCKSLANQLNHLLKRQSSSLSFLRPPSNMLPSHSLRKSNSNDNFIPDPPSTIMPCKCLCLFHHQNLPAREPRNTKNMATWLFDFNQPKTGKLLSCGMLKHWFNKNT